ncbi:MAG: hypothetical protein ACI8PZ_006628 [Myxococcota bacterium]|jgi:hypothetical protein
MPRRRPASRHQRLNPLRPRRLSRLVMRHLRSMPMAHRRSCRSQRGSLASARLWSCPLLGMIPPTPRHSVAVKKRPVLPRLDVVLPGQQHPLPRQMRPLRVQRGVAVVSSTALAEALVGRRRRLVPAEVRDGVRGAADFRHKRAPGTGVVASRRARRSRRQLRRARSGRCVSTTSSRSSSSRTSSA